MALRERVWLNSPKGNYFDKYAYRLSDAEIEQYKIHSEENTAFNYNDKINATVVSDMPFNTLETIPNYMVIRNVGETESRWYVTGYSYISGEVTETSSQLQITLLRDIVVDYANILRDKMFRVSRGNLPNRYTPTLIQQEALLLNQVKVGDYTIEDEFKGVNWAVLYYSASPLVIKDSESGETVEVNKLAITDNLDVAYNTTHLDQDAFLGNNYSVDTSTGLERIIITRPTIVRRMKSVRLSDAGGGIDFKFQYDSSGNITAIDDGGSVANLDDALMVDAINFNEQRNNDESIGKFNGEYIVINTNTYRMSYSNSPLAEVNIDTDTGFFRNVIAAWYQHFERVPTVSNAYAEYSAASISLESSSPTLTLTLPQTKTLDKVNCRAIAIPLGARFEKKTLSERQSWELLTSAVTELGTELFLGVQLRYYNPCWYLKGKGYQTVLGTNINLGALTAEQRAAYVVPIKDTDAGNEEYYAFILDQVDVQNVAVGLPDELYLWTNTDIKKESISKMVRFNAPNQSAAVDINPFTNAGIHDVYIDSTLMPDGGLDHIYWRQGGLSGNITNQSTPGLVYSAFNVSQVNDIWANYKLQNSLYQQIFDRQVENMDIKSGLAEKGDKWGIATGVAGLILGGAGGAIAGGKLTRENTYWIDVNSRTGEQTLEKVTGLELDSLKQDMGSWNFYTKQGINPAGVIGAVAGMAAGGINLASQIAAVGRNRQIRAEDRSYALDMFQLNNQQMQARPHTLSKTGDFNIMNRGKAYIEVYDCTDEEKTIIDYYLKYAGMTINRTGYLEQYLINDGDFIQASLIRMEGLDPMLTQEIAIEVERGRYVQQGLFDRSVV